MLSLYLPENINTVKADVGVINLRGRVLPLIDINLRFGKPEREYTDRACIIIVDIEETHVGLIVDAVDEVLDIDSGLIPPASGLFLRFHLPVYHGARQS